MHFHVCLSCHVSQIIFEFCSLQAILVEKQKSGTNLKSKKLLRKCIFCALTQHIRRKRKDEERVRNAMSLPKKLKREAFANLQKEGIFKTNMELIQDPNTKFYRERSAAKTLIGTISDVWRM